VVAEVLPALMASENKIRLTKKPLEGARPPTRMKENPDPNQGHQIALAEQQGLSIHCAIMFAVAGWERALL
jgi:hypothetical protein